MDTKGGKPQWGGDGGVLNWAIGIDMYTLMCIKLMTNKNLQYKQTNKQTKQLILNFLWVICMEITQRKFSISCFVCLLEFEHFVCNY